MNNFQLSTFKEVVDKGGFTKASRSLGITQSAVSQQIKSLEEELSCRLLHRRSRQLELTPDGEFIYQKAVGILAEFDGLKDELQSRRGEIAGKVKVGSGPVATRTILADVVANMLERFPRVSFTLRETGSRDLKRSLLESRIDVGVGIVDEDPRFQSETLLTGRFVLICSTGHAWSSRRSVSAEELANVNLIRHVDEFKDPRLPARRFEESHAGTNFQLEAIRTETIIAYVRRDLGVAVAPDYVVQWLKPEGVSTVDLDETIDISWGIMSDRRRPLSKAAMAFIDQLKRRMEDK